MVSSCSRWSAGRYVWSSSHRTKHIVYIKLDIASGNFCRHIRRKLVWHDLESERYRNQPQLKGMIGDFTFVNVDLRWTGQIRLASSINAMFR